MSENAKNNPGISVGELAQLVEGTVKGDAAKIIRSCGDLSRATDDQVSFLYNTKYLKHLETTNAGCVILAESVAQGLVRTDLTVIVSKDPYYSFRQAIVKLHGFRDQPNVGISPQAVIASTAKIGKNVNIHPLASIGENVTIGDDCQIYPHVAIMANSTLGNGCIIYPNVTIYDGCQIGNRVIMHSGAVVGCDGFGFATHQGQHHKIPQVGTVIIEDDVELSANVMIERAAMEMTIIGKGTKIGDAVVVGHNSRIGEYNLLVAQVGIAGSVSTGKYVVMGGQVGVAGHLHIADMTRIAAQSGVVGDIKDPGLEHAGSPAMEAKHARRVYMQFTQLPEMAKRLRELENEIKKLKKAAEAS